MWKIFVVNYTTLLTEMAEILKIGVGSLNLIENDIMPKRLSAKVIVNICIHFKVPASSLLERK